MSAALESIENFTIGSITETTSKNGTWDSIQSSVVLNNGCLESEAYRNPFNGFVCSDHTRNSCKNLSEVLNWDQLDELLTNCPKSCNVSCA